MRAITWAEPAVLPRVASLMINVGSTIAPLIRTSRDAASERR
jgi:hypothetical protein